MALCGITITKKKFELNYSIIKEEGLFQGIKATGSNRPFINHFLKAVIPNYERSILVNLKAVSQMNYNEVVGLFEGRESVDLAELNGLTMVHEVIVKHGEECPRLPLRNQEVTLAFEYALNKFEDYVVNKKGRRIFNTSCLVVPEPKFISSFSFPLEEEKPRPSIEFSDEVVEEVKELIHN